MHMVPVGATLQELELIATLDPSTDVPQSLVNRRIEHRSSVFGRKHQMVKQNRDVMALVMALVDVKAHPRDLRRKRRGMHPKGFTRPAELEARAVHQEMHGLGARPWSWDLQRLGSAA